MGLLWLFVMVVCIIRSFVFKEDLDNVIFLSFIIFMLSVLISSVYFGTKECDLAESHYGTYNLEEYGDNTFLYANENDDEYNYMINKNGKLSRYSRPFHKETNIYINDITNDKNAKLEIKLYTEKPNKVEKFLFGNFGVDEYKVYNFYIPEGSYERK